MDPHQSHGMYVALSEKNHGLWEGLIHSHDPQVDIKNCHRTERMWNFGSQLQIDNAKNPPPPIKAFEELFVTPIFAPRKNGIF